jgi:uncharacterized membrane protein
MDSSRNRTPENTGQFIVRHISHFVTPKPIPEQFTQENPFVFSVNRDGHARVRMPTTIDRFCKGFDMLQLILGLALFLGVHALQSVAPHLRQNAIDRWGAWGFKGAYSALSLLGLCLLVQGYGLARLEPSVLWTPPRGMQHATILLMWLSMVLLAAAYVPGNQIKAKMRHPMTLSVKVWALGHLLSNGNLADVLLFGGFLLWSVLVFRAARQRDRLSLHSAPEGKLLGTVLAVVVGTGIWAAFLMGGLHLWLVGVMPFTRAG